MTDLAALLEGVQGWCTPHKAEKLYELASLPETTVAIEIGIFGGASLLPVAQAFSDKLAGHIYGIEPWDNSVAVEFATSEGNDEWWRSIDFPMIKRGFYDKLRAHGLEKYVRIIETPSDAAVSLFRHPRYAGKVDLVHVDGSHSTENAMFDVVNWSNVLRPGGYLVLDDINWKTVEPAVKYMKATAEVIYISENPEQGAFGVFRKRKSDLQTLARFWQTRRYLKQSSPSANA